MAKDEIKTLWRAPTIGTNDNNVRERMKGKTRPPDEIGKCIMRDATPQGSAESGTRPAELSERAAPALQSAAAAELLANPRIAPPRRLTTPGPRLAQCIAPSVDRPGWLVVDCSDHDATHRIEVPTLVGLDARPGDRLLLLEIAGLDVPLATGVVDGLSSRARPSPQPAARLQLARGQSLEITDDADRPLVALSGGPEGPRVRLLADDLDLELPGALRLRAESLRFEATAGMVEIEATHDIRLEGEVISLN